MPDAITKSSTGWFDLPKEILDMILSRMSFISLLNFRAVCTSSRNVVRSFTSSSLYNQVRQIPLLMLTGGLRDTSSIRFSNLQDEVLFKRTESPPNFYDGLCLGTSHSWLVMLDENISPYLFNPFSLQQIQLPNMITYPDIRSISGSVANGFSIEYNEPPYCFVRYIESVKNLREDFICKAVLSANPSRSNGNFYVVMIFEWGRNGQTQLAFCRSGDNRWSQLGGDIEAYRDIICHDDVFYVLDYPEKIEIWDVNSSPPIKRTDIMARFPQRIVETMDSLRYFCTTQSYLVEVSGDLFLVERFIGRFWDEVGPYQLQGTHGTLVFQVYKLDASKQKWEEVESLGDQVFFLGANQSKSLPLRRNSACKANSIYFTDDSWKLISGYIVHFDVGVFHMEDKSIKPYHEFDSLNEPPPIWVDPEYFLD